jgi:hypothetical protein
MFPYFFSQVRRDRKKTEDLIPADLYLNPMGHKWDSIIIRIR